VYFKHILQVAYFTTLHATYCGRRVYALYRMYCRLDISL